MRTAGIIGEQRESFPTAHPIDYLRERGSVITRWRR